MQAHGDFMSVIFGFFFAFIYKIHEALSFGDVGKAFLLGMVGAVGGFVMKKVIDWLKLIIKKVKK